MPHDLFISYSRCDNAQGRITELVGQIKKDFVAYANRELVPFFDQDESTACPTGGSASYRDSASRACCLPTSRPRISRVSIVNGNLSANLECRMKYRLRLQHRKLVS
jgi:hypothetical protein